MAKSTTPNQTAQPRATAPRVAKPKTAKVANPKSVDDSADGATADEAKAADNGLRLKDLVEQVTASSGLKKKDVKTVIEATLLQIGAALQKGDSLNLAGLGRMRVARAAAETGGAITLKLRLPTPGDSAAKPGAEPLADDEDQD